MRGMTSHSSPRSGSRWCSREQVGGGVGMTCFTCGLEFDQTKDFFIVINERKGPSRNFDSLVCATTYLNDED